MGGSDDPGRFRPGEGERSGQLWELCDAGMYAVDGQGEIIGVNSRAERLLGRAAEDMLGQDAHDLLHRGKGGEPWPRSRCAMRQLLITGGSVQGEQEWFERGDGSLLPVFWYVTACRVGEGGAGALILFHEADGVVEPGGASRSDTAAMSELDRLALLAETTTTLTASLDERETLRQLVHLVVPLLADWAVVDLLTEEGGVTRTEVVHYESGVVKRQKHLEGPMPPLSQESGMPLSRALRGVAAALVGPEDYQGPPDSDIAVVQRLLFEATGMHSACVVPIRGVRDLVGAMTLGRSGQPEAFTAADLLLVEDIARRAGLALDNARLYERQRRVAETMQRHLLPRLPRVPGVEMTACYLAAPHASRVGGDWYDAFVLSSGAVGLVIGDVVGHDLDAASGMAQVCNMLRAYAGEAEEPPSVIVDRLDQAVTRMAEDTMATVVFARLERSDDGRFRLCWTNAGHPPPLVVERNGRTRFLEDGSGLLLGTGLRPDRVDAFAELTPGSTVVLYTDGLIESPHHPLDEGLSRLRRSAGSLALRPLGSLCDALLTQVRPEDNDDDVAMLMLRIPG